MGNRLEKYLQIAENRVFMDIAEIGCGSACAYCFTKSPNTKQILLDQYTISELCEYVRELNMGSSTVISLCPNTEPLKSKLSRELTLQIVNYFAPLHYQIQISTKESIDREYLSKLNNVALQKGQIRISISLPYLEKAFKIEPYAAPIQERLNNFLKVAQYKNCSSTLYLRPFNKDMLIDQNIYANIINEYKPDHICLGAEFVQKSDIVQRCTNLYDDELAKDIFSKINLTDVLTFADYIRLYTGRKVFHSSVCNIANDMDYGCKIQLYKHNPRLCHDCRLYKKS